MFYLVDKKDEEIRKGDKRIALRRARRKLNDKSLRIVEGATLASALKAEKAEADKAAKKVEAAKAAKKAAPAKKQPAKKAVASKK